MVQSVYALYRRGDIGRQQMLRTRLEFFDKLLIVSLVKLENELVLIAHDAPRPPL